MAVAGAQELAQARRQYLAALARAIEARGLTCRSAGPEESVLRVVNPVARRQLMVVATPVGSGWSYLWAGGGMAEVADVERAAEMIVRVLS